MLICLKKLMYISFGWGKSAWIDYIYRHETVMAIESESKVDDEQWLAYWILYSLLTLLEMILQPVLEL